MKFNKLIALALVGVMSLSMLTACGGGEESEGDYENETTIAQDVEDNGAAAVSDETWNSLIALSGEFAKYKNALEAMGEDVPQELVDYVNQINERVKEVASINKDTCTEEMAVAATNDIQEWIDTFSQYVTVE